MTKFFKCNTCNKIVAVVEDSAAKLVCCGSDMVELVPSTTDGAVEKHVPVVTRKQDTVRVNVGSVDHPMVQAHYIAFIALETDTGLQIRKLTYRDRPEACFRVCDNEKLKAVYEYCNLHGLWKTDL